MWVFMLTLYNSATSKSYDEYERFRRQHIFRLKAAMQDIVEIKLRFHDTELATRILSSPDSLIHYSIGPRFRWTPICASVACGEVHGW